MERTILHCDCNSFFASVETALNPSYADVPMAVCGSQEDRHGIVLAKNIHAQKYGIKTAETVYSAMKKCPGLILAPPHYDEYVKYSRRINEICAEYTDLIEPFGIDESWLDVTASRRIFGSGMEIADKLRGRIKKEVGVTISVGVSFNKIFAKLGSDYKKPDAVTLISRDNFREIVFPLPVSELLFIGKKTAKSLESIGIKTIGELASQPKDLLLRKYGKIGEMLYSYSNGLDDTPVDPGSRDESKSISNGYTFKRDLLTFDDCMTAISYLTDEIGNKLKSRKLKCNTIALTVKDISLHCIQRQRALKNPTDISKEISRTAFEILKDEWTEGIPIRMLTVTVSGLVHLEQCVYQANLFDDDNTIPDVKTRRMEETVDMIRQKFGNYSISTCDLINNDIGIYSKDK